jgi:hypothetical protein
MEPSRMTPLENPLCLPISTPALDAGLTSATVLNYIMVHHEVWTETPWGWVVTLATTC